MGNTSSASTLVLEVRSNKWEQKLHIKVLPFATLVWLNLLRAMQYQCCNLQYNFNRVLISGCLDSHTPLSVQDILLTSKCQRSRKMFPTLQRTVTEQVSNVLWVAESIAGLPGPPERAAVTEVCLLGLVVSGWRHGGNTDSFVWLEVVHQPDLSRSLLWLE